jgi:hypothetical protein
MKFFRQALVCLTLVSQVIAQGYFLEEIKHQGLAPYNADGPLYKVFRNVKDFGAKGTYPICYFYFEYHILTVLLGDGVTDDTTAINAAIKQGARCVAGPAGKGGCASSTTSPAIVYFPAGTYVSKMAWIATQSPLLLQEPMLKISIDHFGTHYPVLYDTYPWQPKQPRGY